MDNTTYRLRRQALRMSAPHGAILILGNDEAPRNYADNVYPFRQDSSFLYYVGVAQPGMALLMLPDGQDVLFGQPESLDDVIWLGPHPTLADYEAASGCDARAFTDTLGDRVARLLADGTAVHYLPPYRGERRFLLGALLGRDPRDVDGSASIELVRAVIAQRSLKTDAEVVEIEEALTVTAAMYRAAIRATQAGRTEAEIAGALLTTAVAMDRQPAFSPIVSVRGEVLHNTTRSNTLGDGDLLLIDSGAESAGGYASDITRTFPVTGRFSSVQRDIYQVVLAAQLAAIEAVAPGVTNLEVHLTAARTIAEGLTALGLMRGNPASAVEAGAHALFMPHGIGHMLGLDVHDMEDLGDLVGYPDGAPRSSQFGLNALRLARAHQPGFVVTIEPGIYFIPALIDRWRSEGRLREFVRYETLDRFAGFGGIRIEDDVLVMASGRRVLGPAIPKSADDVEEAMAR